MIKKLRINILSMILLAIAWFGSAASVVMAGPDLQQPTVAVATVTGTPEGPAVRVNADQAQINVRSGPGTEYTIVGVLVAGQIVPAYGKSAAGLWIQVGYSGIPEGVAWVYSPLVTVLRGSDLAILEPPPTPTPLITPTIDPTLAAQFIGEIPATQLPTFTAPPPLAIPTFAAEEPLLSPNTFPIGLLIAVLAIVGLLGTLFSLFRR